MPPKRKQEATAAVAPVEEKKKRRIEEEEEEQEDHASEKQSDESELPTKAKESECEDVTSIMDPKVRRLVSAAINLECMKPALTEFFDHDKIDAARLEDVETALDALGKIEEDADVEDELTNSGKLYILKLVNEYLEHVPWKKLNDIGQVARDVLTNFHSIKIATTNLSFYLKLRQTLQDVGAENMADYSYKRFFNYDVDVLKKNTDEYRTILKYLADTNDHEKVSLQVKDVFVFQERPAYAEQTHPEGFEAKYKDTKRMLLWHGLPRSQAFHALAAGLPVSDNYYGVTFTSHFPYAVCQERGDTSHRPSFPDLVDNACLLLAEVAVGDVPPPDAARNSLMSLMAWPRRDPCRVQRVKPDALPNKLCRRSQDAEYHERNSTDFKVCPDGVLVPQGPLKFLPLAYMPSAPFTSPTYYVPSAEQFRLRYLVVVDYLPSPSDPHASPPPSPASPPTSSFSLAPSSPPLSAQLTGLSLPSMSSAPLPILPTPPMMSSSVGFGSSAVPLSALASHPPAPLPSATMSYNTGTTTPSITPLMGTRTYSSSYSSPLSSAMPLMGTTTSYITPAMGSRTYSPSPLSSATPTLIGMATPSVTPPLMGTTTLSSYSLAPPPPSTMLSSPTLSPLSTWSVPARSPEWQFYKPEDGSWEKFDAFSSTCIETDFGKYSCGTAVATTVLGPNGVFYGIDFGNMIQYRMDDPGRIRKIRRVLV